MKEVLVVDGGGRGNALAHALSNSRKVEKVYVAPGNAGVHEYAGERIPLPGDSKQEKIDRVIEIAKGKDFDLVVPGPEGWISAGIVDEFQKRTDIPILGPTEKAAFLETSKCDTKDYLSSIGVPVPRYRNFDDPKEAKEYAREFYEKNPESNLVPKADGIAAGKGAFVCGSLEETLRAIDKISGEEFNREYDNAGRRIEIEERLRGQEISFFAITDGETVKPFGTARDYKKRYADPNHHFVDRYFDGINPNTGGLGAYSPQPLGEELQEKIMDEIARPTVENLDEDYRGILHFVLMVTEDDGEYRPHVLEINVRDGDPEAQVRLPRLDTDFYDIASSAVEGKLDELNISWQDRACVGVCAFSGRPWRDGKPIDGHAGYPGKYLSKQPVFLKGNKERRIGEEGIKEYVDGFVYHNGTDLHQGNLRTRGGRVLTFVNTGDILEEAREKVYSDLDEVFFTFMDFRKDIADL